MTDENFEYEEEEYLGPSKSQVKREMHALQALGLKLTKLREDQLIQIPLSDKLHIEILQYKKLKANEARRRQMQFIGKLMRSEDAEEIETRIEQFDSSSLEFAKTLHQLEKWRDNLLDGDNNTLTEFVNQYPQTDIQALRQLIRNTRKDRDNNKNTGQYKKLFRFIREVHDNHRD